MCLSWPYTYSLVTEKGDQILGDLYTEAVCSKINETQSQLILYFKCNRSLVISQLLRVPWAAQGLADLPRSVTPASSVSPVSTSWLKELSAPPLSSSRVSGLLEMSGTVSQLSVRWKPQLQNWFPHLQSGPPHLVDIMLLQVDLWWFSPRISTTLIILWKLGGICHVHKN